jgi:mRNA interferase MazF
MKRGDIISVSLPRDYGKPRPALVIQSDAFRHLHSVTVLPLTSEILDAETCRITIEASRQNGLRRRSQVMVDKASTLPRLKTGPVVGRLSTSEMAAVNRALALFFGFA